MALPPDEERARSAKKMTRALRRRPELLDVLSNEGTDALSETMARPMSPAMSVRSEDALSQLATATSGTAKRANELGLDLEALQEQRYADRELGPLQRAAITPIAAVLKAADQVLARPIRHVAAAAYGMDQSRAADAENFHAVRHRIKPEDIPLAARPFSTVVDLGETLGGIWGQATKRTVPIPGEDPEDFLTEQKRDVARAKRAGGDIAFDMVFDISNALGLGTARKGAESIGKAATRGLTKAEAAPVIAQVTRAADEIAIPARQAGLDAAVRAAPARAQKQIKAELDALVGPTAARLDTRPATFLGQDIIGPRLRAKLDDAALEAKKLGVGVLSKAETKLSGRAPDWPQPTNTPSVNRQIKNIQALSRNAGQAEFRRSTVANVADMQGRIAATPELRDAAAVNDAVKAILTPGTSQEAANYRAQVFGDRVRARKANRAAQALTDLFKSYEPRLQAVGVAPQPNKTSGLYYPNNAIDRSMNEVDLSMFGQLIQAAPGIVAKHGGSVQNLKKRASDVVTRGDPVILKRTAPGVYTSKPNPSFEAPIDLGEDLGIYADVIARAEGFKRTVDEMERLTGKKLGDFPPELGQALANQYPAYYESMARILERAASPKTGASIALDEGLGLLDSANSAWRYATLTANPAHHTKNLLGDTSMAVFGGGVSPLSYYEALTSKGIQKAKSGEKFGIGQTGFLERSDLPGNERTKNILELQRAAGKQIPLRARAVEALGAIRDKLPAPIPIGTKFGDWWQGVNQRAIYLDSLKKMGPEHSTLRALDVGIDYLKPLLGSGSRNARMFQANLWPYARYGLGAVNAVASEFPGNLARAQAVPKILRDLNQDFPNEAPAEVAQSGYALRLPEVLGQAVGQIPRAVRGEAVPGPFYTSVPQGQLDAIQLPATVATAVLSGRGDEIGKSLIAQSSEPIKQVFSYLTGIDTYSMQKAAPATTDVTEGALGVAGMALPVPLRYPINVLSDKLGGPDRIVGGSRSYDPEITERSIPYLTSMLGFTTKPGVPEARVTDVLATPEGRDLMDLARILGTIRKNEKTRARIEAKREEAPPPPPPLLRRP